MLKLRLLFLYIISFLLAINIVLANDYYTAKQITADVDVDVSADIIKESSFTLDYIEARLSFFPFESSNQVIVFSDLKTGKIDEGVILYRWESVGDSLEFGVFSKVKSFYDYPEITGSIPFPFTATRELNDYLIPTEHIDSDNEDIINLASQLASGGDDVYAVVFNIGGWVENNINYSLTTTTHSISQKASWVLENRYGVCDEITVLFIAMLRSVGIPAKYISGVAYSNFDDLNSYGPHAWAEVYIGDRWVPFDITYGEYGFSDASHIKMSESNDASSSSVAYKWRGSNINIKSKNLGVDVTNPVLSGFFDENILLNVEFAKGKTGFGSYNLAEVTLENPDNFYKSAVIFLSRSDDIEIIGTSKKAVLLLPNQKKKVFWKIKISEDLDDKFVYTIPLVVTTSRNISSQASFQASNGNSVYSEKDIQNILEQKTEEKEKVYSSKVSLECIPTKESFYTFEEVFALCTVKNMGNNVLNDLKVCADDSCRNFDLGINQDKDIEFLITEENVGEKELIITAKNKDVYKLISLNLKVLDVPKLVISDIDYPERVGYDDEINISFVVEKVSVSNPNDVFIKIVKGKNSQEWQIPLFDKNRKVSFSMPAKNLRSGTNEFSILVEYKDEKGELKSETESFEVELTGLSFFQKFVCFLRNLI